MNIQEYAKIYQKETDKQLIQGSTTGWMDKNARLVIYNGGNEVKVPYIEVGGYKDYDRSNGYPKGSSKFNYETHKFDMDRGISLSIDSQDVDETNFSGTAANLIKEFNETQAIPEKDAYRLSSIFKKIPKDNKETTAITEKNALSVIKGMISKASNLGVDPSNIVIQLTWDAYNKLTLSEQIYRSLNTKEFKVNEGITLNFKTIDESIIIPTASERMRTDYIFYSGDESTDGAKDKDGFEPKADAGQINILVMPANAPIGITKCDKFKIIDPDTNQDADAWKINSRVYHTLILTSRKAKGCFANYTAGTTAS